MIKHKVVIGLCFAVMIAMSGCSRQQSDWQKTREANTAEAYDEFLKKYPSGEFTAQAQARAKELYEERDWQKARDADTPDAYQAFLKQYPEGKWTEEARIRVENFTLAQAPSGSAAPGTAAAEPGGAPAGSAPPSTEPVPSAAAPTQVAPAAPSAAATPPLNKPAAKGGKGHYAVQLGAFKSGTKAAKERWTHLQARYPALLAGLSSKVLPKKTAAGNLYRLQAVGLSEKHARELCAALRAKSQPCLVVPPP